MQVTQSAGQLVKTPLQLTILLLAASASPGQSPPAPVPPTPIINATSTLVLVPTLVRSPSGDLIPDLHAADFRVTDNGVEQKVALEETTLQPLSLVILMQTGGAAPRQFAGYRNLTPLVEALVASSSFHVALVTFDSRPEELWNFPSRVDGLSDAFSHPEPGDSGAAILDAVSTGLGLLEQQPASSRRILLLLSQPHDEGSTTPVTDIVRRIGKTNTTVYSISFSPEKAWLKDQFTGPRHGNPPYQLSPVGPTVINTFDLGAPLGIALKAMRADTAAEIATLSGGEHMRFSNKLDLETRFTELANHIPNRYVLSFQPTSPQPGLHTLGVQVLHQAQPVSVTARGGYWSAVKSSDK